MKTPAPTYYAVVFAPPRRRKGASRRTAVEHHTGTVKRQIIRLARRRLRMQPALSSVSVFREADDTLVYQATKSTGIPRILVDEL